ncbi:MAG: HPr family phosphocarrier protein [Gammaproteobacteria bacterium]|jgi:phosphocarrier protein|nr:HPr family phosphocarrier protein [Gammaproteobacteria bacterium]
MLSKQITIINKLGLHARASAKFVAKASRYGSQIEVVRDNKIVNGKSIMGVMMLAASKGTQIELRIDGDDEAEALAELENLINNRFGEEE